MVFDGYQYADQRNARPDSFCRTLSSVGEIRVGTSGWHYPTGAGTWNGVFYPAKRPRGFDELAYYAEHFDTVEVNATFYRMPEAPMSAAWVRRTPSSFLFAIKLYQKFTHPDMYLSRDGVRDWDLSRDDFDLFRTGIAPIAEAGRLGAVLAQFPPSFHDSPDARAYLDWLLGGLAAYPVAVELRHRSWSDAAAETRALLAQHHAAWTFIDEPKFQSSVRQAFDAAPIHESPIAYVRLHGRNAAQWWDHSEAEDRYNYLYSEDELAPFSKAARDAARREQRVLMYLNNHFSAKSVANAAILKRDLGQLIPGDYPVEMIERYPELKDVVRTENRLL
jgi:uncharacterized protein YecE (DUF72 family)